MLSFRQTLRYAPPLVLIAFMVVARACAPSTPATSPPVVAPTVAGSQGAMADIASVYAAPTFDVVMTKDIVYAQGLSHQNWGSESAEAAIRWINATADDYSVGTDHLAVIGGSAGSVLAVG